MRNLWQGAAVIAFVSGALAGCASPHYPVREGEAAGPPPLTMPKPKYPTTDTAPAAAPPPAAPAQAAAAAALPAAAPPPPAAADATPKIVTHDEPAPPAVAAAPAREASATVPAPHRAPPRFAVAGEVVAASGVFENYEVQRGDHIDELARGFKTTRQVLIEANGQLRPPYRLHPGEILKVP